MPESPALPPDHPVYRAAADLNLHYTQFRLNLAGGTLVAHLQVNVRAIAASAERFLHAIAATEERDPGFAGRYGLQLIEDPLAADSLVQEQGRGFRVPDDPSGLEPGPS